MNIVNFLKELKKNTNNYELLKTPVYSSVLINLLTIHSIIKKNTKNLTDKDILPTVLTTIKTKSKTNNSLSVCYNTAHINDNIKKKITDSSSSVKIGECNESNTNLILTTKNIKEKEIK